MAFRLLLLCLPVCADAQTGESSKSNPTHGRPASLNPVDLLQFGSLPDDRRNIISESLSLAKTSPWLPYTANGASPADGGFDCSGAMYFILRKVGLDPPRFSAGQLQWLRKNDRFHDVPQDAVDLAHPSMKKIQPGDLLFWGRRGAADSGAPDQVTHVALFLGYEKVDGRSVMINSTDGRSYRGVKANGYGVYDFRLPPAGARVSFLGYGTPPGIEKMIAR